MGSTPSDELRSAVDECVEEGLRDLLDELRIPSISARGEGLQSSAEYLSRLLARDGWAAEIVDVNGNPVVFAEIGRADGPAIVLYGHHDVQPVEPESDWTSPPFDPQIRDGRIFARGAADNKGQFFCHIFAVRALRRRFGGALPRVCLVLDGQEELASPHIREFVERYRTRMEGAHLVVTADGPTRLPDRPEVVFGSRGSVKLKLTVRTANRDFHSGNWGNLIPSAAWRLAQILAAMKGSDGRVTVPGFYDRIVPPTDAEREAMAEIPFALDDARTTLGVTEFDGPDTVSPLERVMFLPTMTVAGIWGGYMGPGFKTVIPGTASAYLDVRLVADQTPDWMFEVVQAYLRDVAPDATLEVRGRNWASRTPLEAPAARLVVEAVERGFGRAPLCVPCAGGSLPANSAFASVLGAPVLSVPYGDPEQRNHAADESIAVESVHKGSLTSAALLMSLGALEQGS